jgi:hypothetical protein
MSHKSLRDFIWERCEADDRKTDEIMEEIFYLIPNKIKGNTSLNGAILSQDDWMYGWNSCIDTIKEKMK